MAEIICIACGLPVTETPSGTVCPNGHGGAPTRRVLNKREQVIVALNHVSLAGFEAETKLAALTRALRGAGLEKRAAEVEGWGERIKTWTDKIHKTRKR